MKCLKAAGLPLLVLTLVCLGWAVGAGFDMVKAYQDAHKRQNLEALMSLVWWEGVDATTKDMVRRSFQDDLKQKLVKVSLEDPPAQGGPDTYTLGGVKYGVNLRVVKRLKVEFAPQNMAGGATGTTTSFYRLGMKNGRYYIATAAVLR